MKKKLFIIAFAGALVTSTSSTAFAADIIPTTETLPVVDQQTISDGYARTSAWGEGILHATNPISGNPYAYAETKACSGTAYKLTAQAVVIDADSLSYYTPVATAYNAASVKSDTIVSKTKKTFFVGNHTIQKTSSSGIQSCTTSGDYKN